MNKSSSRLSYKLKTSNQLKSDKSIQELPVSSKFQETQFKSKYTSLQAGVSQQSFYFGSQIAKLQEQGGKYAIKMENELKKMQEIEQEISKAQEILNQKRQEVMKKKKANGNNNDPRAQQAKIKSMHTKLDLLLIKQNESNAQNDKIKEDINQMRREKNIFDKIFQQSEIDIKEKKEKIKRILKQQKIAQEVIQQAQQKLEDFQNNAAITQEEKQFQIEQVLNVIDPYNKEQLLQNRFNSTYFGSQEFKQNSKYDTIKDNQENDQIGFITQPMQGNNSIYEKQMNNNLQNSQELPPMSPEQKIQYYKNLQKQKQEDQQQQLKKLEEQVNSYQNVFQELKVKTEKESIDEIAKVLLTYDQENFSLFKEINQIRDDLDELQQQRKQIQLEIQQEKQIPKKIREEKRMKEFEQLQKENEQLIQQKEKINQRIESQTGILKELFINLPLAFKKIKCEQSKHVKNIHEKEWDPDNLDQNNILNYLSLIEKRILDLVIVYQETQKNKDHQNRSRNKKNPTFLKKTEDFQQFLYLLDQDVEDQHFRLQEQNKGNDQYIIKDKDKDKELHGKKQLEDIAKQEIKKVILNQEKNQKLKKKQKNC